MLLSRILMAWLRIGVLLTLLAACGHAPAAAIPPTAIATVTASTPTAEAQISTAACELLKPAEAAVALGIGATTLQSRAVAGKIPTCYFKVAETVRFKLFLHRYRSVKEAIQALQTAVKGVENDPTFKQVAGLGDEAFAKGAILAVRKQSVILTVSINPSKDTTTDILVAKSLAQTALTHLPAPQ